MTPSPWWRVLLCALVTVAVALVAAERSLASLGAGALLHPHRRVLSIPIPAGCSDIEFSGHDVMLAGWHCGATATRRGTLIYLHGVADNRAGAAGVAARFTPRGFDVVAYDSRAHGASAGDVCTYGYYEKRDLSRVIDAVGPDRSSWSARRWAPPSPSRRPPMILVSLPSSRQKRSPTCEPSLRSVRRSSFIGARLQAHSFSPSRTGAFRWTM